MAFDREGQRAWRRYLVAQFPGWLFVVILLALATGLVALPAWTAILLLLAWIGRSMLAFSRMNCGGRS